MQYHIINGDYATRFASSVRAIDEIMFTLKLPEVPQKVSPKEGNTKKHLIRESVHSIEEIEFLIKDEVLLGLDISKKSKIGREKKVKINGKLISLLSDRYKLFFTKGYQCVTCGLVGSFFALEKHVGLHEGYHLNLYAIKDGEEILMTKDHITPKSKGGKSKLVNYQTMCSPCNKQKGNLL